MYQRVVMTCGLSLLTREQNVFSVKSNLLDFPFENIPNHISELKEGDTKKIHDWVKQARFLFHEAKEKPNDISAEYSMLYTLKKQRKLADQPEVVLILTDTPGGQMVEKVLTPLLEEHFNASVQTLFQDMDITNQQSIHAKLAEFMNLIAEALTYGEPGTTCFAPIGGYKVLTSVGYIVGSYFKFPTAYLHEDQQVLIEIPPLPIDIDETIVEENLPLIRQLKTDFYPFHDLEPSEQRFIQQYPSLFTIEEGLASLSSFGSFIFDQQKYTHLFSARYKVSKQVKQMIEKNKHHKLFVLNQMKQLVKKLVSGEMADEDLRHEKQFDTIEQSKVQYYLYKGSSYGQMVFRLCYKFDFSKNVLYANYLWIDHNRYEREAREGKGLYESQSDFEDITNLSLVKS